MHGSYRRILVAAFGWLIVSAQAPQPKTETEQAQARSEPKARQVAVPVETVQPVKPVSRPILERPCKAGQDERQSDLCAQWKAADAAYNAAWWAKAAFWLGLVGTVGLFLTLKYTRDAVKLANDATADVDKALVFAARNADAAAEQVKVARETATAQLRPYLICTSQGIHSAGVAGGHDIYEIFFKLVNTGQTPARITICDRGREYLTGGEADYSRITMGPSGRANAIVPPNEPITITTAVSSASLFRNIPPNERALGLVSALVSVSYKGMSDPEHVCYRAERGRVFIFTRAPDDGYGPATTQLAVADTHAHDLAT